MSDLEESGKAGCASEDGSPPPCCGSAGKPEQSSAGETTRRLAVSWLDTPAGRIPKVDTELTWQDWLSTFKVRLGIGRMRYRVEPGLYGVGSPNAKSPVFVTANFKLSFDHLRRQLNGIDSWILMLDTKGINVWCAAGKGTFGTDEMVRRIESARLADIVSHRRLIVPQLGAPGTSAHEVQKRSGFTVIYGPVRAKDLPRFMADHRRATPEMRRVRFDMLDRALLIPVEIVQYAMPALLVAVGLVVLAGLGPGGYSFQRAVSDGAVAALLLFGALLPGVVLTPLLLPWLPGRAFAVKGAWLGAALAAAMGALAWAQPGVFGDRLTTSAWLLFVPAMTSFVALNFTGASTFTSLSGVLRETAVAVPIYIVCAVAAAGLWIAGRFV